MAGKRREAASYFRLFADKSLEDWKKVKALYKESFTSAQRAPFRSLMAQPEEGESALTAYLTDSQNPRASYAHTKGDITYIPYIAFKDCPKDAETVIFSLLLDAHKGNRIVLDVARTISEDKKKARQKRLDFFKNAGFTETGISGKDFGVEYDYYALGGKVTREELTEFTEDFWNSLDA